MKILMIICDGMSDRPSKELNGKTPLQVANKPNIDKLAQKGQSGLMCTIDVGVVPGSDTAHLALLGYDPHTTYTGRGPFEAGGIGLELRTGDIAFRANFSTVDEEMTVIDRRAGRIASGTDELADALNGMVIEDVSIAIKAGVEHRAALVLRGAGLSPKLTDTDPHELNAEVLQSKPQDDSAEKTARVINEFTKQSYEILKNHPVNASRVNAGQHPANIVLCRGAGEMPDIQPFSEKFGVKGAAIVGIPLVKGLCRMVGLDVVDVPGATGCCGTDLDAKVNATIEALKTNDFVLLHIKGTDVMSHDFDAKGKTEFIESIDKSLGNLMSQISDDVIVALTADHSTPICTGEHSADPVPLTIAGGGLRIDNVTKFDEISAAGGSLGNLTGSDLLPMLLGLGGWRKMFGA